MRKWITVCLFSSLVLGCNKPNSPDCFQVAGVPQIEWRTLSDFDEIEISDNIDVYLEDSDEEKIKVEGPSNLLPEIKTEIENNILKITNDNTCNFVRSYKHKYIVTLYSKNIRRIINRGTGVLKSVQKLRGNYLFIENNPTLCGTNKKAVLESKCLKSAGNSTECDLSLYYHIDRKSVV
jgi:hypothetical protein